jgi:hypothetical protein
MARNILNMIIVGCALALFSCSSENTGRGDAGRSGTGGDEAEDLVLAVAPDTSVIRNNGEYEEFYPNGIRKTKGFYLNGKRNGQWFFWYENGKMWSVGFYKDGVRDGRTSVYYENGQLRYDGQYKDGKRSGKWKFYDEAGKLLKEEQFD